jgi:hypothetical protein
LIQENTNLSNQLSSTNLQNQLQNQPLGPFIRNGTTFEQIALNTVGLANGTSIIFREVFFTYVQRNSATTLTFEISYQNVSEGSFGSWSEILTVNSSKPATLKTAEVYTSGTSPIVGLVTNLGYSDRVWLVVSI